MVGRRDGAGACRCLNNAKVIPPPKSSAPNNKSHKLLLGSRVDAGAAATVTLRAGGRS